MDWITSEHLRRNRQAQEAWNAYANHRQRVGELLTRGEVRGRLCVLGSGNCNDLDLARLADTFAEVHLVDLDSQALNLALKRQAVTNRASIVLHGEVDVTGIADQLAELEAPSDEQIAVVIAAAGRAVLPPLGGPFEVVASVGLLTQLIDSVVMALREEHPQLLALIAAVRRRHLELMLELLPRGGMGLLVTEIVSSETAPELLAVPEAQLAQLAQHWIEQRNFFTGVNPFVLQSLLRSDPALAPSVQQVQLLRPWRWQFVSRTYAVCALRFFKA